jgi:hypothetical protein
MKAEAGSSGGESRPVTEDGAISWHDTLYFDMEPDDTEVEERSKMQERSRSHEESDIYVDNESSDGSDAYEEASEQITIETSNGKGRATADSTGSIADSSTKATASSEPGSGRPSVSSANRIDSKRQQDRFLNALEVQLDWNVAAMVGEQEPGGPLNRSPAPSRSRLDSMRREMLSSPKRNSSTGSHRPWTESHLDPVDDHERYIQSGEQSSSNSAFSPPPLRGPYLSILHPPMLPFHEDRAFDGYAPQFSQPHSTNRPRVMRGLNHHEDQQEPTRTGGRSPYSAHRPTMVIPRQCIPYKGLRTATDRWHEVVLPFHISRVDEAGRYLQLVVFDVDNFHLYAFALVDDISVLRDGDESEEDDDNHIIDQTSATMEDVPGEDSADGNESLHQRERFQDALEEIQVANREEPELYNVCCSECHGRGWLKVDGTNDGGKRASVHRR